MAVSDDPNSRRPEYELKFLVPASRAAFLSSWIGSVARPDPVYPPARVVTVYFDTRSLAFLAEKVDSDYLKAKARIRWYAGLKGEPIGSPVFAECKYRRGSTREKVRVRLPVAATEIGTWPLTAPQWSVALDHLRAQASGLPPDLSAVIRLRYVRSRFSAPPGGRITLDTDICVEALNRGMVAAPVALAPLPTAVFEYKGTTMDLPVDLAPVVRFGARKSAFSKYLACFEHLGYAFI